MKKNTIIATPWRMFAGSTLTAALVITTVASMALTAQGAVLQVDTTYGNGEYASLPVSNTDLINFGQVTLDTFTVSANADPTETPDQGAIDGTATANFSSFTWFTNSVAPSTGLENPAVFTFNLDVSVNTLGYAITQIDSYAGWSGVGRQQGDQIMTVEYSLVGNAGFATLGTYTYLDPLAREFGRINLTDDTATYMLYGVDALRFSYADPDGDILAVNSWRSMVLQEIDVFGVAVPEPSSIALLGLGLSSMLLRRRRS